MKPLADPAGQGPLLHGVPRECVSSGALNLWLEQEVLVLARRWQSWPLGAACD
ncbi:hypothetical protein OB947_07765 [Aeromonas bestiarum]|uniref:hypothetical protein n=1 Tax=Aeromonas bestiarum TaxID=105751 RepID=UPI00259FD37F|nr:hypothetical protein [Aeromonas bestiarum]MDM5088819.1 hypothetical protein [Aeromonas bestiarum]